MRQKYLIFFFFFSLLTHLNGQSIEEIEAKISEVQGDKKAKTILSLLDDNFGTYVTEDSAKTHQYILTAIELARQSNNQEILADAYLNLSQFYEYYPGFDTNELEAALKSLEIFNSINNEAQIGRLSVIIGNIYKDQGNLPDALKYYLDAKPIFEKTGDKQYEAIVLGSIGLIYLNENKYNSALDYFQEALDILLADSLENNRSYEEIAITYTNMGRCEAELGNYNKAMDYFIRAKKIDEDMEDDYGVAFDYFAIAEVLEKQNSNHSALKYVTSAIERFEEVGDNSSIIACRILEGKLYRKMRLYDQALEQLTQAVQQAKHDNTKPFEREGYEELSKLYEVMGDIPKAFETYKQYIAVKDSITSSEVSAAIEKLRNSYEVKEKAKENERLQKEIINEQLRREEEKNKRNQLTAFSLIGGVLLITLLLVIFSRYKLKQKANDELEQKNKIIAYSNEKITGSIRYGRRIQKALLAAGEPIELAFPDSFVFLKPKDIVSGDFFWYVNRGEEQIIAAIDCTGHGVPGAFMTVFGYSLLNKIVNGDGVTDPSQILALLGLEVMKLFQTKEEDQIIQDGMDMALCKIDQKNKQLHFAGANRPLLLYNKEGQHYIKGDKVGLGGKIMLERGKPFNTHTFNYETDDTFYIFSDGYQDQFGGPDGKKFMSKRFRKYLADIQPYSMQDQAHMLETHIQEWMINEKQTDDMIIIGIRLK
ncbi:MAG: tetratricopeptide repeat protein [Flammeovirgaceae bacterium]